MGSDSKAYLGFDFGERAESYGKNLIISLDY